MLKIKHNEMFSSIKEHIIKKLDVPDKEFEKVCATCPAVSYLFGNIATVFLGVCLVSSSLIPDYLPAASALLPRNSSNSTSKSAG